MSEVMIQLVQYMVAFGGLITLFFFIINFLTKGFIQEKKGGAKR